MHLSFIINLVRLFFLSLTNVASVSGGNPSLTVRNDQIGVVGRSIDDIIAYDKALLANDAAHATAEAYVAGLSNSEIKIGKKSKLWLF